VICRVHCDGTGSEWPLSRKFGCDPDLAPEILELTQQRGLVPFGMSFHVGSQQHNVAAWDRALASTSAIFRTCSERGMAFAMVNLGGGFPDRGDRRLYDDLFLRGLQRLSTAQAVRDLTASPRFGHDSADSGGRGHDGCLEASKYPPAKPGALGCEPLKAAYPRGFDAVSHLLRGMPHQVAKLTMLIPCVCGCTPICRGVIFALSSIDGTPFRVLGGPGFRASSMARGSDFGKCQTFAASPAEPGELPLWFRRVALAC
jgi:hypothetical protein